MGDSAPTAVEERGEEQEFLDSAGVSALSKEIFSKVSERLDAKIITDTTVNVDDQHILSAAAVVALVKSAIAELKSEEGSAPTVTE